MTVAHEIQREGGEGTQAFVEIRAGLPEVDELDETDVRRARNGEHVMKE